MIHTRPGTKADISGILSLQKRYLYSNLDAAERKKGFVTTPFTAPQIENILQQQGVFIAENQNREIVAYAFAGSWSYFQQWEIFNFMVERLPKLSLKDREITTTNSFQYGPVCIDKPYRGQGLINQLFECMRKEFYKTYPISLTFINQVNTISKHVHIKKLGWEILEEFEFNQKHYLALGVDMSISVLK